MFTGKVLLIKLKPKAKQHSRWQTRIRYSFIITVLPTCTAHLATRSRRDIHPHTRTLCRGTKPTPPASHESRRGGTRIASSRHVTELRQEAHCVRSDTPSRFHCDGDAIKAASAFTNGRVLRPLPRSRVPRRLAVNVARTRHVRRCPRMHDDQLGRQKPTIRHRGRDVTPSQASRIRRRACSNRAIRWFSARRTARALQHSPPGVHLLVMSTYPEPLGCVIQVRMVWRRSVLMSAVACRCRGHEGHGAAKAVVSRPREPSNECVAS